MSARWEDILRLPEAAYAGGRRVPKTVLTSRAMLTRHEQRTLDKMSRLEHFATVAKGTAQVLPRVDEEYDIQSVIFLRCEMKGDSQAVAEVARLLHGCFPNPTVILQEAGDSVSISVALTRKSHAERGATVVYDVESTGLFNPGDRRYEPFLDSLAFERLPQDDLLSYLGAIASCVRLSQAIVPLGFYPACAPQDRDRLLRLVAEYRRQQAEVDALATERRGKDVSPNESARIRMDIRKKEQMSAGTLTDIKCICVQRGDCQ
ncbi:DUF4391 domain-containing protein [Parafannyhessea umbonata]|jgi:hypothetical protein|uniref:DUF4391 domain-containing protein n=1 Tax=Parafannyhessea umbonata TaxID=604330 RepID=A0A6N7WVS4_9ACTN|nr:DUF4391 domain-containing protein [Parafannyhessea umbonata]MST60191.1 DUF4391 domain-containing protein [Parafannyhessea umbonata]